MGKNKRKTNRSKEKKEEPATTGENGSSSRATDTVPPASKSENSAHMRRLTDDIRVYKPLVQELCEAEVRFLKELSDSEKTKLSGGGWTRSAGYPFAINHYSHFGEISLVLARIKPCCVAAHGSWDEFGRLLYDQVLKPWYCRHEDLLRAGGFVLDMTPPRAAYYLLAKDPRQRYDFGNAAIFKDTTSPLASTVDDIFSRMDRPVCMEEFRQCFGYPGNQTNSAGQSKIIYQFQDPELIFKVPKDTICCSPCTEYNAYAATDPIAVGQHFRKCRKAMLELGFSIALDIDNQRSWSAAAIAAAWNAAAGEDLNEYMRMCQEDILWLRTGDKRSIDACVLNLQAQKRAQEVNDECKDRSLVTTELRAGNVAVIHGLKNQAKYNGHSALLMTSVLTDGPSQGRVKVLPEAKGSHFLAIKVENLSPVPVVNFSEKAHQRCMFWPTVRSDPAQDEIHVLPLPDWPFHWSEVKGYFKSQYNWIQPELLSGITSRGQAKPDFQMYFDAADVESPINHVATAIYNLLPSYEQGKAPCPSSGMIRGPCVLRFSPTKSMVFGPRTPSGTTTVSASANKQWSLHDLQTVLYFHTFEEAREQYKRHDNPMHRMFGDMY